jgi:hypothetical protein
MNASHDLYVHVIGPGTQIAFDVQVSKQMYKSTL